jgi:hypothetical protein
MVTNHHSKCVYKWMNGKEWKAHCMHLEERQTNMEYNKQQG